MFDRVDVQRLAGIRRILGVDLADARVHIVELECGGMPFKDRKREFRPVTSLSVTFTPAMPLEERAEITRSQLRSHGVSSCYAVFNVNPRNVKIVEAEIPQDMNSIEDWIEENLGRLLRLPMSFNEVSFGYRVARKTESGGVLELAFARKSAIRLVERFSEAAGLHLIGIGAGALDAVNTLLVTGDEGREDATFIYVNDDGLITRTDKRYPRQISTRITDLHEMADHEPGRLMKERVVGLAIAGVQTECFVGVPHFRPFGLPSEYTLAAGLAIKGFLPELNPVDMMNPVGHAEYTAFFLRQLSRRVTITLGGILLVLLLVPTVAAWWLQAGMLALDEQRELDGVATAEFAALKTQIDALELGLSRSSALRSRPAFSRVMYLTASSVPRGLWFSQLDVDELEGGLLSVSLRGHAHSNDIVAQLMRNIRGNMSCQDLALVRAEAPDPGELRHAKRNFSGSTVFHINAVVSE